jgi:hypothetical protein
MRIVLRTVIVLAVVTGLLGFTGYAAAQSSASYELTRSVMSGGGTTSTSASYELTGTLGQPSPVDVSDSTSYNLGSGFWGATVRLFSVAIESISYSIAEGARITWESFAGANYTIQFTENLTAAWQSLSQLVGTGGLMEWLDDGTETGSHPGLASVLKRFYRLVGQPGS